MKKEIHSAFYETVKVSNMRVHYRTVTQLISGIFKDFGESANSSELITEANK